jgi:methyl-accepting chemotaxis protein
MKNRKYYLINPKFQLIFSLFVSVLAFVAGAIFCISNFYFFWKLRTLGTELGIPTSSPFFQYINHQQLMMMEITVVTAIGILIISLIIGILFSHRICGPLRRLENHMKKIAQGNKITRINFRKNDFFPEISTAFNSMLDHIKTKKDPSK